MFFTRFEIFSCRSNTASIKLYFVCGAATDSGAAGAEELWFKSASGELSPPKAFKMSSMANFSVIITFLYAKFRKIEFKFIA